MLDVAKRQKLEDIPRKGRIESKHRTMKQLAQGRVGEEEDEWWAESLESSFRRWEAPKVYVGKWCHKMNVSGVSSMTGLSM